MIDEKYCISLSATILDALIKINHNNMGFVIVIFDNVVHGTLTDGDIRRQLISGKSLSDKIIYNENCKVLVEGDDFNRACELFLEGLAFIPIVCRNNSLKNVITRKKFETFILSDLEWDTNIDFLNSPESDYFIQNRPWGFYKSTLLSSFVQAKVLTVFPGERLSLQMHERREEHWVVIRGKANVVLGKSIIPACPGKYIFIPKQCKHQIINDSESNFVISEVQLGDYFGEDDIIRFEDKYGRTPQN